jgi:hypothetical protein
VDCHADCHNGSRWPSQGGAGRQKGPSLTEQPLADVVAAARDLSDLVQKLQYGQRVKVIWLRCTSNPPTTLTGTSSRSRLRLTHYRALS